MNDEGTVDTYLTLFDFGFTPKEGGISCLVYNFGNFKLFASRVMNMRIEDVILFTGVLATPRSVSEVDFEMPLRVGSREECAAWIVCHLDRAAPEDVFVPKRETEWITEGRQHESLLPWVRDLAAYEARPHCTVQRDWLRVALKTVQRIVDEAGDEAPVIFAFDGAVLTLWCAGKTVAFPAEGTAWPTRYSLPAKPLRRLPKRLMRDTLGVSFWNGRLNLASCAYDGVSEVGAVALSEPE